MNKKNFIQWVVGLVKQDMKMFRPDPKEKKDLKNRIQNVRKEELKQ